MDLHLHGANLSTAAVAVATADLVNGYLPTTLGGTTVSIDGKAAYLNYVSPTQINVQTPNSSGTGSATVAIHPCGLAHFDACRLGAFAESRR